MVRRSPTTAWGIARRIEDNYARQLQILTNTIGHRLRSALTIDDVQRLLMVIANDPEFNAYCEALATNMANRVAEASSGNWRRAAMQNASRRGRIIFEGLQAPLSDAPLGLTVQDIILENSALIKTIPNELNAQLASIMAKESAVSGVRHESLTRDILGQFFDGLEDNEYIARRIARTETGKAHMALTQARAQSLGLNWYVWQTAQDGKRVRDAHRHMQGVLVNWNNPPDPEALIGSFNPPGPYHAGCIWNCRCFAEPIIDPDWIDFPRKIFLSGTIQSITLSGFKKIVA